MSVKLNLGAGECWAHAPEPWVNVDARPVVFEGCPHRHMVGDLLNLDVTDDEAEALYAGHVFEHLQPRDVFAGLGECYQVLRPGGDLLIVGPDAAAGAALYSQGVISWERLVSLGMGDSERSRAFLARGGVRGFEGDALPDPEDPALHKWVCSAARMTAFAEVAGFVVRPGSLDDPAFPVFDRGTPDQFAILAHKM